MTSDGRLPIARSSRGDQQRPQLTIDVEIAQMRTDQMESLSLARRQRRPRVLPAFCGARQCGALRDHPEQRQAIQPPPGPSAP
jgi:hypothetical protein